MRNHEGLSPIFDLSRREYFLDFILVPIGSSILIYISQSYSLIVVGVIAWTLVEYLVHRIVFHGPTRFEPMHQMHHRLPKDMIGVSSWGTFAGFSVAWFLFGAPFTAGFMIGYLFYCVIHLRFHHHDKDAKLSRYVAFMNEHHAGHHRGGKGNFGVSSPVWDFVFGTYR